MASIYPRKENGYLVIEFFYKKVRFREQTRFKDSKRNRQRLAKLADKIEAEKSVGVFDYAETFPGSKNIEKFERLRRGQSGGVPLFKEFSEVWLNEMKSQWRESHLGTVRLNLEQCLWKRFGKTPVDQITKADILAFRTDFSEGKYSKGGRKPSPDRINKVEKTLEMILNEASERYKFSSPASGIKSLKITPKRVEPFSLEEITLFLENVRPDFKNYYTVRFLTGLRTGEINGLKWEYVDFARREIMVREAVVNGKTVPPKTPNSIRDVRMSEPVYQALLDQEKASKPLSKYVFCLRNGNPLEHGNVSKRVWYPTLKYLGLKRRTASVTRHTTASLWLASGENPEWVARQLGHSDTQMLFKTYSKYIPNLTRRDGSAFDSILQQSQISKPQDQAEDTTLPENPTTHEEEGSEDEEATPTNASFCLAKGTKGV